MPRYFLDVRYDGTAFHGSQVQGALPTVQGALDAALFTLLKEVVHTFGASRTDEGVHALQNFYHFDWPADLPRAFIYQTNAILPRTIGLNGVYRATDPTLNARFAAVARRYCYCIHRRKDPFADGRSHYYPYKLDPDYLQPLADVLRLHTDYTSFAKRTSDVKTFECTIHAAHWAVPSSGGLEFIVEANRFLRGMVRGLVGTMLRLARYRHGPNAFLDILHAQDCRRADFNVPGHGLYLEEIRYPDGALSPYPDGPR